MKQIIPFNKEITFKTTVSDITSISLDHDLQLKGEDLIKGNFYIKGKFKMTKASITEEEFSYKIPCEIAISDDYDTYDASVDIDDFYYELLDDSVLKVNIALAIDNLVKKERCIEEEDVLIDNLDQEKPEKEDNKIKEEIKIEKEDIDKKVDILYEEKERINPVNVIKNSNESFETLENSYQTYYVYLTKEDDTFDTLKEKYQVTKEDILNYNDITEITPGIKVIIPQCKNE